MVTMTEALSDIAEEVNGNGSRPASFLQKQVADRLNVGKEDPAFRVRGAAPNEGRFPLPHVLTFQGLISSIAKVYRPSDEAINNSLENARFMRNDVGIMECLEARQRAVALLNWHLEPEDEHSPIHKALCDELTKVVNRIKRFVEYRRVCQEAIWYGRYGIQHQFRWCNVGGRSRVMPAPDPFRADGWGWKPINGDKLVFRHDDAQFDADQWAGQVGIRVSSHYRAGQQIDGHHVEQTDRGLGYFLTPAERKMVVIHKHMIEDGAYESIVDGGMIHGVGIRSRIYWDWFQKQEALAFLMEYLERSAGGIELWYYDEGNKEAKAKTEEAALNRLGGQRNVILVPRPRGEDSMAYGVEVIEPGMAGITELKDLLTNYFGHRIKRYILGQVLSSEAEATGLGSGVAELHLDTFLQIIRYDARNLEETLTDELITPLKDWNFPDAKGIQVKFKIETESPDIEKKLEAWGKAYEMGCSLKERDVMDLIGAAMPGPDDAVLKNPQAQQQPAGPFAGPGPGQQVMPGQQQPQKSPQAVKQQMTDLIMGKLFGEMKPGQKISYVKEDGSWEEREVPDEEHDTGDRKRVNEEPVRNAADGPQVSSTFGGKDAAASVGAKRDNYSSTASPFQMLTEAINRGVALRQRYAKWNEEDHPRGQPENAGEFTSVSSGTTKKPKTFQEMLNAALSASAKPLPETPSDKISAAAKSPQHEKQLRAAHLRLGAAIRSSKLTPENAPKYFGAASNVLMSMHPKTLGRFLANTEKIEFCDSMEQVAKSQAQLTGQEIDPGRRIAAFCRIASGQRAHLVLDGGTDTGQKGEKGTPDSDLTTRHVYAHEMSHAIDNHEYSRDPKWRNECYSEILNAPNPPSEYAKRNDVEAFAEFGRMVLTMPNEAEKHFPKCWEFWREKGLV